MKGGRICPQTNRPVRIGIVGTNFVSDWLAEAARQTDCCEAAAVYSRGEGSGAAFAQQCGLPQHFCDYTSMLESDMIDAVYLASPNSLHYPQTMAALDAGKHVLCEKPLAVNAAQGEAHDKAREASGAGAAGSDPPPLRPVP